MKKSISSIVAILIITCAVIVDIQCRKTCNLDLFMTDIDALATPENYSCTVRTVCNPYGSFVECSGTVCSRNFNSVTCDGKKIPC